MRWTLLLVPVVFIAAAPSPAVDDLIRQGNAAFAAKDYDAALGFYNRAEPRTTDPGLVAGNKASALYQLALAARPSSDGLKLFRQAEEYYRCAAEGSDNARRLRTRFGLANSILQGQTEETAKIKEAIAAYRDCLSNPALDDGTADDVRHNLEVAKLHLLRLQTKPREPEKKNGGSEEDPKPPETKKEPDPNNLKPGDSPKDMGSLRPADKAASAKDGKELIETKEKTPGSNSASTIFDETPSPPLTSTEADDALERAAEAIRIEQRSKRYRSSRTPAGTVKDW